MIIYRLFYYHEYDGYCYEWYPSKREAKKGLAEHKRMDKTQAIDVMRQLHEKDIESGWKEHLQNSEYEIDKHNVPTTKTQLIVWLNAWASGGIG